MSLKDEFLMQAKIIIAPQSVKIFRHFHSKKMAWHIAIWWPVLGLWAFAEHNSKNLRVRTLVYKNLLSLNLPVRSPLYKNLFCLKFEKGSHFLKSIKKLCTLGQILKVDDNPCKAVLHNLQRKISVVRLSKRWGHVLHWDELMSRVWPVNTLFQRWILLNARIYNVFFLQKIRTSLWN